MIPIKIRAWDGEKMCYPRFFEFGVCGVNGETSIAFERRGGMCTTSYVMQFTGYADINKVDIYDGDIVKDSYNRILLVERHRGRLMFKALTETNFVWADLVQWFEGEIELPIIIGNVYENKEMLEAI